MRRILGVSALIATAWFAVAQAQAPAAPAAAPAAPANGDFIDAPEKPLLDKACTACHGAAQVTSVRKTEAQWQDTVDKMISYGAKVTDQEFATIVTYLTKHYGPAPAGAGGK